MIKTTYNPILSEERYVNKPFSQFPISDMNKEILICTEDGEISSSKQKKTIRISDLWKRSYNKMVTVDLTSHRIAFENEYYSKDGLRKFIVEVDMMVQVKDAQLIWKKKICDVTSHIEMNISKDITRVTMEYEIENVAFVLEALRIEFGNLRNFDFGIEVQDIHFQVKMDAETEKILRNQKQENLKAVAAQDIINTYKNNENAAIFAEVVSGKRTAEEAFAKIKTVQAYDFDENMRQTKQKADFLNELIKADMVDPIKIHQTSEQFLFGQLQGDKKESGLIEEQGNTKKEKNVYAPLDDIEEYIEDEND